jgi:hypothetical protein
MSNMSLDEYIVSLQAEIITLKIVNEVQEKTIEKLSKSLRKLSNMPIFGRN